MTSDSGHDARREYTYVFEQDDQDANEQVNHIDKETHGMSKNTASIIV